MAPSASVILPTRRRRAYLAVAVASVAPQVRIHGAELIVVEDDPADPETERLATEHGARYLAHGATRGLNAARNTAVAAAASDVLCFLDDDVDVWPGWLEALLTATDGCPEHLVFGGPIRARLEGTNLHPCGREPPPVTTLDLGPEDRDADFAWGANLTLRRRALDLVDGRFDETLDLYGDEEDLQRRLRAQGGRVRYVAGAGVDHRRAGADARIAGLARAAYGRGRNSRRYDGRKWSPDGAPTAPPPSPAAELRTLAGCLAHTVRYRCGNGVVLTAHTAGRLREALAQAPPSATDPDYLSGMSGTLGRRTAALGVARDLAADALTLPDRVALRRAARHRPRGAPQRVLALCVARPEHAALVSRVVAELERSRHDVAVRVHKPTPSAGKWANLNAAVAAAPVQGLDWLLLVDDDVLLPHGFLDLFLLVSEALALCLAQPAHRFRSHAAWQVTRRRPGLVGRRTAFVEIGPVTALHASTFDTLLPFPDLHMGWGLDNHWAALAAAHGWPAGIVDATPIRHTRPVAAGYPRDRALAEAEAFLASRPYLRRADAQRTLAAFRALP